MPAYQHCKQPGPENPAQKQIWLVISSIAVLAMPKAKDLHAKSLNKPLQEMLQLAVIKAV